MPKILVADDNTNIQKMVALAFADRGIDVTSVGNGEAAVRRLPDLNPDLILADIFMPVRNGYELCEWVKKDARFSHVPVILLIGAFDPLDEKEARRVGADGVLKKPFIPPDPLIAMVTSVLEKNPKIAAEIARAKESVPEPPQPQVAMREPLPKIQPKPLPEFPEPSPEEESLVYAFGTGRRGLDEDSDKSAEAVAPVALAGQENEEEFNGASTTSDWRRNAMEFEVPEDSAGKPAFSSEEYLPPSFPPERGTTPQHIDVPPPHEGIQPEEQAAATVPSQSPLPPVVEAVIVPNVDSGSRSEGETPTSSVAESEEISSSVEDESKPEPAVVTRTSHWMDLISSMTGRSEGGWFAAATRAAEQARVNTSPEEPAMPHDEELTASASAASSESVASVDTHEDAPLPSIEAPAIEESFFADEPEQRGILPTSSSALEQPPMPAADPVFQEAAPETADRDREFAEPFPEPVANRDDPAADPAGAPSEKVHFFKDPNLVEAPAARVTPEPLLEADEPDGPSGYGERPDPVPAAHSFLVAQLDSPAAEQPESAHEPAKAGGDAPSLSAEFDDRIPTGPPPSREELSQIPFLNPPPSYQERELRKSSPDAGMVDAIVQKVLEKLEPRIQELLSQNIVKPLVESLLQNEQGNKRD